SRSSAQNASCGAVRMNAPSASQPQRCQTSTATVAASATDVNASASVDVPLPTSTGAASAPRRANAATIWEDQRIAIAAPAAPMTAATTNPASDPTTSLAA